LINKDRETMEDFEKLGAFYLGREYDMEKREKLEDLLLYDSKDLCTHAVVVGMTGSGKTGLCVDLLEEAAIDRIPSIVIDPKGDISNLLLTFPNLTPEEFRPWIDEGAAARKGVTPEVYATQEAEKWKSGLASWGQDGERIKKMRDTVEMRVYTPGSTAGRPLTILKSFDVPNEEVMRDPDLLGDRIGSAVSGLLALVGIDADPIQSREHILISNIISNAWKAGRNLDLGRMIAEIQNPPFERVGIMEIDSFFDKKDRNELAMTINNLLASPSFANWMTGEPLNVKNMLHNAEGKPCVSIISISHLSDQERMFFVTILLNEVLGWMRSQPGTSSLRALLYMDEVFGYFPPTANPPSKQPMLTLLKQARAFGLGVVLATQNPVDLDYKGLSNAGTWFLGRLQTERDKARVLEGLEGASSQAGSSFDRGKMEKTLAGLGNRVFLMNNVHDDHPVVFETRWAMSYLRGPLTRNQIQDLCANDPAYDPTAVEAAASVGQVSRPEKQPVESLAPSIDQKQLVPDGVNQVFVEPRRRANQGERLVYRPALLGRGRLHYVRVSYKVDQWVERSFLAQVGGGEMPNEIWDESELIEERLELVSTPVENAEFAKLPPDMQKSSNFKTWNKELKEYLYRDQPMMVYKCKELKEYSEPGETLGDFKVRLEQAVSEERDEAKEKLQKKYASKFSTLRDRIRRAEDKVEVEKEQYQSSRMSSYLSMGTTLVGALLGRKAISATSARGAGTSMRSMSRASKQKSDIGRAEDNLEELVLKFEDLEREFKDDVDELEEKLSVDNLDFEDLSLSPRKSDISIEEFAVCWLPWEVDESGIAEPIY
jgi:hypothetical protein